MTKQRIFNFMLSFVIVVAVVHDIHFISTLKLDYDNMVDSYQCELNKNVNINSDSAFETHVVSHLDINENINSCQVYHDSDNSSINSAKVLTECPLLSDYPQFSILTKYSNNIWSTSKLYYDPMVKDKDCATKFTVIIGSNNRQLFRSTVVELTTNSMDAIKLKQSRKTLLTNYAYGIGRINMEPPSLSSWILHQLNATNFWTIWMLQVVIYCIIIFVVLLAYLALFMLFVIWLISNIIVAILLH
eukprot:511751_1